MSKHDAVRHARLVDRFRDFRRLVLVRRGRTEKAAACV
jgi:hypothetical protein